MRLLVCGGRDYADRDAAWRALDAIHRKHGITLLIHGACMKPGSTELRGADRWGEEWAKAREVPYVGVPARWTAERRGGGPKRNAVMLDQWHPDAVLALPGGSGTDNMCQQAEAAGLKPWRPYG